MSFRHTPQQHTHGNRERMPSGPSACWASAAHSSTVQTPANGFEFRIQGLVLELGVRIVVFAAVEFVVLGFVAWG